MDRPDGTRILKVMLVLSRRINEAIVVGDDVLLSVADIRGDRARLVVSSRSGDRVADPADRWARSDQTFEVSADASYCVIEVLPDKVRLGIIAPVHVPVHRKEVYEAIRRHSARGHGGDGDAESCDSPKPHAPSGGEEPATNGEPGPADR